MASRERQLVNASPLEMPVSELRLEVPPAEVRRYLGYPRARQPAPHVASRILELWPLGQSLLRPRGALRLLGGEALAAAAVPRPTELLAAGLCTIGPELEAESDRRAAAGEPLEALILDAFGSAAAEAAAEALAAEACARAAALGLSAERRISPGYGRWPVTAQPALLALLPRAELGVELSEGCMMTPRKSVSFVARLHRGEVRRPSRPPCASCQLQGCPFRQLPSRSEGESR